MGSCVKFLAGAGYRQFLPSSMFFLAPPPTPHIRCYGMHREDITFTILPAWWKYVQMFEIGWCTFVTVRNTTLHCTGTFIGGDTFGEFRTYITQAVDRIYCFYFKKIISKHGTKISTNNFHYFFFHTKTNGVFNFTCSQAESIGTLFLNK